jgi:hypothetical protein
VMSVMSWALPSRVLGMIKGWPSGVMSNASVVRLLKARVEGGKVRVACPGVVFRFQSQNHISRVVEPPITGHTC